MFRCLDCGKSFDNKPEFCSCGGNTFEEFGAPQKNTPVSAPKNIQINPKQLVSIVIFVLCIILSIVPWCIKIKEKPIEQKTQTPVVKSTVLPDINSFWDNGQPKQTQTTQQVVKEAPKKITQTTKTVQKSQPVKKTTQQTIKTEEKKTSKTPAPTQKIKEQTKTQEIKKEPVQSKSSQSSKPQLDPKVMYEYKKSLNIALASHMNFLEIQGNGKCAFQFSINEAGKLTNRAFVYQSDNVSVNNEVYKMLMRMPTFTPPPKGYNGELFKISFEMNNGNYKFSYVE